MKIFLLTNMLLELCHLIDESRSPANGRTNFTLKKKVSPTLCRAGVSTLLK